MVTSPCSPVEIISGGFLAVDGSVEHSPWRLGQGVDAFDQIVSTRYPGV